MTLPETILTELRELRIEVAELRTKDERNELKVSEFAKVVNYSEQNIRKLYKAGLIKNKSVDSDLRFSLKDWNRNIENDTWKQKAKEALKSK